MFLIFSGVSGCGKQTVIEQLLKEYKNSKFLKSATTRPPRQENAEKHQYYHLTEEEFLKKKDNGDFFDTENTHGFYYGILKSSIHELLENPNVLYIKDVDVHGTEKLMKALKDKMKIQSVFLEVPDEVLFDRLIKRGESEERAKLRISRGAMEREYKNQYTHVVDNIDLNEALEKVRKIVEGMQK